MQVTISPSRPCGTVAAPPSKSDAHRLLVCAGLAGGESRVDNVAPSEDLMATMDCLRALGARVTYDGQSALVQGADPRSAGEAVYPCRECGSTLRFFVPLALLGHHTARFTGSERLLSRPMGVYESLCRERGLTYEAAPNAVTVRGPLRGGTFTVDGSLSSQFVSGLLFALPLAQENSVIRLLPPVESLPYIRMTRRTLARFGVETAMEDEHTIRIPGRQRYRPGRFTVEGDWSNAAFFGALEGVTVAGLDGESLQGDKVWQTYFPALRGGAPTLDLADCPDLGPVCMALAAMHHGAVFTGTRRLRLKESDRGSAMAQALEKFGISVSVKENHLTVSGTLHPPGQPLYGHNDHRIVMALAVLCASTGGVIEGAEAVRKSMPDFFERIQELGIEVTTDGMDQ